MGTEKCLLLLRHAKSDWRDLSLADFDRPLTDRGRRASRRMGQELQCLGFRPDLVLCSTAVRAQSTWHLVEPGLESAAAVEFIETLYLASPATIFEHIGKCPNSARTVLVVGHNPGIAALAMALAGEGSDRHALTRLSAKFPTAALAQFKSEAESWRQFKSGHSRLVGFVRPKDLD